jgi:hypothetical protein
LRYSTLAEKILVEVVHIGFREQRGSKLDPRHRRPSSSMSNFNVLHSPRLWSFRT